MATRPAGRAVYLLTMDGLMRIRIPIVRSWALTAAGFLSLVVFGCAPQNSGMWPAGYSQSQLPPAMEQMPTNQMVPAGSSGAYAAPGYATASSDSANIQPQNVVGSAAVSSPYAPVNLSNDMAVSANATASQPSDYQVRYQSPDDEPANSNFFVDESLSGDINNRSQLVQEVRIEGNRRIPTPEILRHLKTRAGRYFDPDLLQQDVHAIWRMQTIRRVHGPFLDKTDEGIVITFQVEEHPVINELKFVGNRTMTDSYLRRETGLEIGKPLNDFELKMARDKIQELYRSKGHTYTTVEMLDSEDPTHVVFAIYEDERRTIDSISFEGNQIATDARLSVIVKSKTRKLWLFGGKLDRGQLDRDVELLRAYYYSLGYFNAKVGREIITQPGSSSVGLKFVINEGPRYRIRNIRFQGNDKYTQDELMAVLKLKPDNGEEHPYFNSDSMSEDVEVLRDTYGSVGHIFADVQAQPHFLETPGEIDLVYQIDEGKAYRVGRINIHIDGDGITRRNVILNRVTQQTGDLIDIRKIRQSERLLRASQLFSDPQNPGAQPRITFQTDGTSFR